MDFNPLSPTYETFLKRMKTFSSWEHAHQKPWELAEAGFYYTGNRDFVKCYYCGLGLSQWQRDDMPWNEHRTKSEDCGHLRFIRGNTCAMAAAETFQVCNKTLECGLCQHESTFTDRNC